MSAEGCRRSCLLLQVRPGQEAEYDRRHRELWSDLADEIRRVYLSFTIFRRGRTVVVYGEERQGVTPADEELGARWKASMTSVLESTRVELGEILHLP